GRAAPGEVALPPRGDRRPLGAARRSPGRGPPSARSPSIRLIRPIRSIRPIRPLTDDRGRREGRGRAPSCTRGDATARPGLPSGRNLPRPLGHRPPVTAERARGLPGGTGGPGQHHERAFRALYHISGSILGT